MNGRAMCLVLVALIIGILIGNLSFVGYWWSLLPFLLTLAVYLYTVLLVKHNPFRLTGKSNELIAALLFLGVGIFSGIMGRPSQTSFQTGKYFFSGNVQDYTATTYGDRVLLSIAELKFPSGEVTKPRNVNALVTLQEATNLSYGDYVSAEGYLKPYDYQGNFLKDDYDNYLKCSKIFLVGVIYPGSMVLIPSKNIFPSGLYTLRYNLEMAVEKTPLDVHTKAFIISVLLGDKSYLKSEERLMFTDSGVAHIFAVSGFHVSMISFFVLGLFSLFFLGRIRRWKFLVVIPVVWLYILLVGFSPATCRAGIMITMVMTAMFLQRRNNPLKALGWAVVLILSFNAGAMFDIGFQLSVVCVGSLLLIAGPLNFIDHHSHPVLFRIVSSLLVTLVATFSTWLICVFYFHRFSLMFLPLNLIAVPLLPLYTAVAIIYLVSCNLGLTISLLGDFLDIGYAWFQNSAEFINSSSNTLTGLHPGGWSVILWVCGLAVLGYVLNRSVRQFVRFLIPGTFFAVALVSFILWPVHVPDGIIIQKGNSNPSVVAYKDGVENLIFLPENTTALTELNGKKILALNSHVLSENVSRIVGDADIILLCKGCKFLPTELYELKKKSSLLVTHPSLHWRHERSILASASEFGISVHSLRYNGPLHLFP